MDRAPLPTVSFVERWSLVTPSTAVKAGRVGAARRRAPRLRD
jgi:hypothetical protein